MARGNEMGKAVEAAIGGLPDALQGRWGAWRISLLLLAWMLGSVAGSGQSAGESLPDYELMQKLLVLPFSEAKAELDKLPEASRLQCVFFLARTHISHYNRAETALQYFQYAQEISESLSRPVGPILLVKATVYEKMNDRKNTIACLEQAAEALRKENDLGRMASCLSWMGTAAYSYGYFDKSEKAYDELLSLYTYTNDLPGKARALFDIGEVYLRQGKTEQAKAVADNAMNLYTFQEDLNGKADCLKLLGNVLMAQRQYDAARSSYLDASEVYSQVNDLHGQANCNFNLGLLSITLREYPQAIDYLTEACDLYSHSPSDTGVGIAHMELGRAYTFQKEYDKAEACFQKAESLLATLSAYRLAQAKDGHGDLKKAQGDIDAALILYEASAALFHELQLEAAEQRVRGKVKELETRRQSPVSDLTSGK